VVEYLPSKCEVLSLSPSAAKKKKRNKIDVTEKTVEYIEKRIKKYEGNMQELCDSIKTPNLKNMGIEEGEKMQAKGTGNIFNKIIAENFPYIEKEMPIQV
jgi:hypothetical protein